MLLRGVCVVCLLRLSSLSTFGSPGEGCSDCQGKHPLDYARVRGCGVSGDCGIGKSRPLFGEVRICKVRVGRKGDFVGTRSGSWRMGEGPLRPATPFLVLEEDMLKKRKKMGVREGPGYPRSP